MALLPTFYEDIGNTYLHFETIEIVECMHKDDLVVSLSNCDKICKIIWYVSLDNERLIKHF